MARVIISHHAPADTAEIGFLNDLVTGFRTHGHEAIIWSSIYDESWASYFLPLDWRIAKWRRFYEPEFLRATDEAYALIDRAKWRERVDQLVKQEWNKGDRTPLLNILVGGSFNLLQSFKPDLFLSWNTLCPHTGVAFDMCGALGIPSLLIEKAVFPKTWFIEPRGLVGLSTLAGKDLDDCVPEEKRAAYRRLGKRYLKETSFAAYNRYEQVQESKTMERLLREPYASKRPRVVLFPPDDGTLGFVPADGPDRKATLPHYESSLAAAQRLARVNPGVTIFKPHPSFLERSYNENDCPELHIVDYDFRKVIEWADVVASTGTGLEFVAMAMGKPVLLMANDILAGKHVAYEAQDPADLAWALKRAKKREGFSERQQRFAEFCGYLVKDHIVSARDASNSFRDPARAAEELCADYLADASETTDWKSFHVARARVLNDHWAERVERGSRAGAGARRAPLTDTAALTGDATQREGLHCVVDFDYTLITDNSSDMFLKSLRPRLLAFLVVSLSDVLVREAARYRLCDYNRWRDFFRICITSILFPWNLVAWRVTARKRMARIQNHALIDSILAAKPSRITVISNGFHHLIDPLLAELSLGGVPTTLLASSFLPVPSNMRRKGKVKAVRPSLQPDQLSDAFFVTDSEEDQELINYIPQSYLLQWGPYSNKPFAGMFFPLRYAVSGKYSRRRYLWNQLVKEDLLLILLAYQFSFLGAAALCLLFVSFMAVYEIGYYENDYRAARRESKPTLSKDYQTFEDYPIWKAWPWSIALAVVAMGALFPAELGRAWDLIAASNANSSALLEILAPASQALGAWLLLLVLVRAVFGLFNRLRPKRRIALFPLLHGLKTFGYALLFPLAWVGGALLASQVLVQTLSYYMHRNNINRDNFNRQAYRFVFFCIVLIPILILSGSPQELVFDWRFGLILFWIAYRSAERRAQQSLPFVAAKKLRGAYRRARNQLRNLVRGVQSNTA